LEKENLEEGNFYPFKTDIKVRDNEITDKFYYNGVVDTIEIKSSKFKSYKF
jgi:hypothetical protein